MDSFKVINFFAVTVEIHVGCQGGVSLLVNGEGETAWVLRYLMEHLLQHHPSHALHLAGEAFLLVPSIWEVWQVGTEQRAFSAMALSYGTL